MELQSTQRRLHGRMAGGGLFCFYGRGMQDDRGNRIIASRYTTWVHDHHPYWVNALHSNISAFCFPGAPLFLFLLWIPGGIPLVNTYNANTPYHWYSCHKPFCHPCQFLHDAFLAANLEDCVFRQQWRNARTDSHGCWRTSKAILYFPLHSRLKNGHLATNAPPLWHTDKHSMLLSFTSTLLIAQALVWLNAGGSLRSLKILC